MPLDGPNVQPLHEGCWNQHIIIVHVPNPVPPQLHVLSWERDHKYNQQSYIIKNCCLFLKYILWYL
jgi:hypothetical protein